MEKQMKFANKAGLFLVAAGISFGASAMQDDRQLVGQWEEQSAQRSCPEVPFVTYNQERCTDLGCTKTVITENYWQKTVTTITESKGQVDQRRLDRKRTEEEFPREKLAICDASQTPELMWNDVDQAGQLQQQSACGHKREGIYTGNPTEEKHVLALANEIVEEYFNQDTETVVTKHIQIFEKRSNDRQVSSTPASKEGEWQDVCGKASKCANQCDSAQQEQVSQNKVRRHKK